jgi:hypothetical protein
MGVADFLSSGERVRVRGKGMDTAEGIMGLAGTLALPSNCKLYFFAHFRNTRTC